MVIIEKFTLRVYFLFNLLLEIKERNVCLAHTQNSLKRLSARRKLKNSLKKVIFFILNFTSNLYKFCLLIQNTIKVIIAIKFKKKNPLKNTDVENEIDIKDIHLTNAWVP